MSNAFNMQDFNYQPSAQKEIGWRIVTTIIIPLLFTALFTQQILNIMAQPDITTRIGTTNLIDLFFVKPILLLFFVFFIMKIQGSISQDNTLTVIILIWSLLTVGRAFQSYHISNGLNLLRFITEASFFVVGIYLSLKEYKVIVFILKRTFWLSLITILVFIFYMTTSGRIVYYPILGLDFRPQDVYSMVQSTEFSNIVSQIFLVGMTLFSYSKIVRTKISGKIILFSVITLMIILLIYLFSVATLLIMTCIFVLAFTRIRRAFFIPTVIFAVIVFIYLGQNNAFVKDLIEYKSNDVGREYLYTSLVSMIIADPIGGVGIGRSVNTIGYYPHQNLLGSWVEGGITWFLLYLGIVIFNVYYSLAVLRRLTIQNDKAPLFYLAMYSLIYWHAKGLIEDTWYNYEIFLWSGVLYGIYRSLNGCNAQIDALDSRYLQHKESMRVTM